jgi:hypothetical protein
MGYLPPAGQFSSSLQSSSPSRRSTASSLLLTRMVDAAISYASGVAQSRCPTDALPPLRLADLVFRSSYCIDNDGWMRDVIPMGQGA